MYIFKRDMLKGLTKRILKRSPSKDKKNYGLSEETSKEKSSRNEYEDGIFHVIETRKYADRMSWWTVEKTAEGEVTGVEEEKLHYASQTIYHKGKDRRGIYLDIKTPSGTGKAEFPRDLSLTDRKAIRNQRIKYFHSREDFDEGTCALVTNKYRLEILSGPLEGERLEEKILS